MTEILFPTYQEEGETHITGKEGEMGAKKKISETYSKGQSDERDEARRTSQVDLALE